MVPHPPGRRHSHDDCRPATAQYLYELGADADRIGYGGRTPLDIAREQGATDVVEWLSAVATKPVSGSA
ncbi:ankyrin repeat domain-containing protein [Streptomyces sp. NPDC058247]|uniref:ankyrin repeat domain-containing protein n=1 Tax=Streptomyces sp. NPDC058247 TaxID=3346401 RepID=UPI0036E7263B